MQLSDPALFKQHAFINGIWLSAASQKASTSPIQLPANGSVRFPIWMKTTRCWPLKPLGWL